MTTKRDAIEAVRKDLRAALELYEAGDIVPAREKYRETEALLGPLQIDSPYVLFCLAETFRGATETAELEAGFDLCCRAVQLDPLHPALMEQFTEYGSLLRRHLERLSRDPRQPDAPKVYALLQRAGEADAASHVAMARHHAGNGRLEDSTRLLQATLMLEPSRPDAWQLLGEVTRQAGREAEAAGYEARAAELEARDAPYGVPSPSVAC